MSQRDAFLLWLMCHTIDTQIGERTARAPTGQMTMEFQSASSTFSDIVTGRAESRTLKNHHIVDQLIEERGQTLVKHPLWPIIRPMLYKVLYYRQAVRMADEVAETAGVDTVTRHEPGSKISELLPRLAPRMR